MLNNLFRNISIAAAILAGFTFSAAAGTFWANAKGAGSCERVCNNNGARAVSSGNFTNGKHFLICSANAHGQGFRAGYNLEPNWSNACVVGYGGKELFVRNYSCLCE